MPEFSVPWARGATHLPAAHSAEPPGTSGPNIASGEGATVGGGDNNDANGPSATVGGAGANPIYLPIVLKGSYTAKTT